MTQRTWTRTCWCQQEWRVPSRRRLPRPLSQRQSCAFRMGSCPGHGRVNLIEPQERDFEIHLSSERNSGFEPRSTRNAKQVGARFTRGYTSSLHASLTFFRVETRNHRFCADQQLRRVFVDFKTKGEGILSCLGSVHRVIIAERSFACSASFAVQIRFI